MQIRWIEILVLTLFQMTRQFNIESIDMGILEQMTIEDIRSYVSCKYDIDTAKKIIEILELKLKQNEIPT